MAAVGEDGQPLRAQHQTTAGGGRGCGQPQRLPVQHRPPVRHLHGHQGGFADEVGHERRGGMVVDGARGIALHEAPVVDDRDAVRHGQRLALVVGDVDGGHAELLVQVPELDLHVVTELLVERRQRLVHEQDPGLEDDGPSQRHPLLLTAGELVDAPLGEPVELHGRERTLHPLAHVALRHPPHPQGEGDVPGHRHVRKQRVVLEHHAHVPPVRRHPDDLPITEADAAVVGAGEPRQHHQQGGLAGAGGSEQGDELPAADLQVDIVEGMHVAVGLGDPADVNGQRPVDPGATVHWP